MNTPTKKVITASMIVLLILFAIALATSLTFLIIVQDVRTLDMHLAISNVFGFNIDTDKIYFGDIPPGTSSSRKVIVSNDDFEKSIVRIKTFGDLKDWVIVSEKNFILEKGEYKLIEVSVYPPPSAEYKEYEGKLLIILTRF